MIRRAGDEAQPAHYFGRGRALQAMGDPVRAIEDYTMVVEIQDWYLDAYLHRAECFDELGLAAAALRDRQRALVGLKSAERRSSAHPVDPMSYMTPGYKDDTEASRELLIREVGPEFWASLSPRVERSAPGSFADFRSALVQLAPGLANTMEADTVAGALAFGDALAKGDQAAASEALEAAGSSIAKRKAAEMAARARAAQPGAAGGGSIAGARPNYFDLAGYPELKDYASIDGYQLQSMCSGAHSFYQSYLNAVRGGMAGADRTYAAHQDCAEDAIRLYELRKGKTGYQR
jgi:tetratricopeptide (TPR) repeat protein